jgi:hypothetical protein
MTVDIESASSKEIESNSLNVLSKITDYFFPEKTSDSKFKISKTKQYLYHLKTFRSITGPHNNDDEVAEAYKLSRKGYLLARDSYLFEFIPKETQNSPETSPLKCLVIIKPIDSLMDSRGGFNIHYSLMTSNHIIISPEKIPQPKNPNVRYMSPSLIKEPPITQLISQEQYGVNINLYKTGEADITLSSGNDFKKDSPNPKKITLENNDNRQDLVTLISTIGFLKTY